MTNIFTKKKTSIWKEFAEEIGGEYIDYYYWHSDKTELHHQNWKIIFDNYTEHRTVSEFNLEKRYTRVLAPFISLDDFRFEIYNNSFFSAVAKMFGAQDMITGYPEFDKKFIVKTNNEFKMKSLLRNKAIRTILQNQKKVNIQICDQKGIWEEKLPEKEMELSLYFEGKIKDIKKLKLIRDLFTEMLNELYQLKSIDYK